MISKTMHLAAIMFLLLGDTAVVVQGFVSPSVCSRRRPRPVCGDALMEKTTADVDTAVRGKTEGKGKEDWVATWMSDLQEWWDTTIMHHEAKPAPEATAIESAAVESDDWVAKELIEIGEEDVVTTGAVDAVEPASLTRKTVPKPKPKVQKTTYEWLTQDMIKAGKAEKEAEDWVANDMKHAGRVGPLHGDWVAEDMKEAGEVGAADTHATKLRKSKTNAKTEADKIADGMRKAGRGSGVGWIARDMKEAGAAQEKHSYAPWTDRLRNQLDREHEKRYDDVYKGMEKAGAKGSMATDWVEGDMVRAGKAESMLDRLKSSVSDVTYKLEGWQKDRYDVDKVKDDVETAGHADAQDWIAHDMTATGQNRSNVGRSYPAPEKDLREWLNTDEKSTIAKDMEAEGKALGGRMTRKAKISRSRLSDLVAHDMEVVGTTSANWVETDMERAGRGEPHLNQEAFTQSHRQRETEAFMSSRKPKLAKVAAPEESEAGQEVEQIVHEMAAMEEPFVPTTASVVPSPAESKKSEHNHRHRFMHSLARATKKVIMPWKAWQEIE
jgi:hypothetical protein